MPRPFNPLHRVRGATRKKHADDDGIEVEDKHRDGDEEDDEHEREPRDKKHKKKKEKHHRAHDEEADDDDDDDDDDGDLPSSTKAESCLGCLDPLRCCPTREEVRDGSLVNRLLFSLFAVTLLWVSCLDLAVRVTTWFITSPTLDSVWNRCSYAYTSAKQQNDDYQACVSRQLMRCDSAFSSALDDEIAQVESAFRTNEALLEVSRARALSATSSFISLSVLRGRGGLKRAHPSVSRAVCGRKPSGVLRRVHRRAGSHQRVAATER